MANAGTLVHSDTRSDGGEQGSATLRTVSERYQLSYSHIQFIVHLGVQGIQIASQKCAHNAVLIWMIVGFTANGVVGVQYLGCAGKAM